MQQVTPSSVGGGVAVPPVSAPMYRRPRPLNAALDKGKSLRPLADFSFARSTNAAVLVASEFAAAMRSYPIVFAVDQPPAALAVLGLRPNENLFVAADGKWLPDHYIPAYMRRYPFILMENQALKQWVLSIDEASGLLTDSTERPLFSDGQPTKLVTDALAMCGELHAHNVIAAEFVGALAKHDLLVQNEMRVVTGSGEQLALHGFQIVNETKFNALPDEVFLDWRRRGWLQLVFCHLQSMANWPKLVDLAAPRPNT